MKSLEEFKALSLNQIKELGYDKIRECQEGIKEILGAKSAEINARAKEAFMKIIGDVCPDFEISTTVSAYRMFVIRIPGTRYEIDIDVEMDGYGDHPYPEIGVSAYPNVNSFSVTNPDEIQAKLIKMYYAIIFKEDIHTSTLNFVLSIKDELNEIKDEFRRYKAIADSIHAKEEEARKKEENEQLQKNCLETLLHERPRFIRIAIKGNNPDMHFIYRGESCDFCPDSKGKFTSDYKRKKDECDFYDVKVRWIPADRLKDKNGKYILNDPELYK